MISRVLERGQFFEGPDVVVKGSILVLKDNDTTTQEEEMLIHFFFVNGTI